MSYAIPGLQAFGSLLQGNAAGNASRYNAGVQMQEAKAAEGIALTEETTQRRNARQFLGKQATAVGQAGIGYGGSAQLVMDQSAVNAELDALNIRYRGKLRRYGYETGAAESLAQGKAAEMNSYLLAGSQLLKGYS